jgi:AraC-like DNA-binding protein
MWSTRLGDLARDLGLKTGQVEREMQRLLALFGLPGPGLRSAQHQARMTMAAMYLSGKGVSIAEAASLSGYGSTIAMARAFRDAGLPSPSAVQKELLDSWEE